MINLTPTDLTAIDLGDSNYINNKGAMLDHEAFSSLNSLKIRV